MAKIIEMSFPFGALKEIKTETGIDYMDRSSKAKEIKPGDFQTIARIGIKWGASADMSDEEAGNLSDRVTFAQVNEALTQSFTGGASNSGDE